MNFTTAMSDEHLADQAIDWLVLLRSGSVTAEERLAFETWLAESAAHRDAFEEAQGLLGEVTAALKIGQSAGKSAWPTQLGRPIGSRRSVGRPSWLALAASLVLAVWLGWPQLDDRLFSDYATAVGEQREVVLADGSRVLLNTDSAIALEWSDRSRRVVLRRGQASFRVAQDVGRPFEVVAGPVTARALGTVFEVHRHDEAVDVAVTEHAVSVRLSGEGESTAVRINEAQGLHYLGRGALGVPEAVNVGQLGAWQRGKLIFRDQTLAEVVEEINRYSTHRILVSGQQTKTLRMSGVFPTDNVGDALEAIRKALAIHATRIGPWLVVLHS
ncbi:FecR family protein [Methylococcus sp. EFPC2]|uniref:FecR family protein n=1 Tax=Methylococcus sp. EFPC2 TaxID=2812648 RepID=UPI001967B553|nr:FecR family protein [Methylococcus sp. EFPC2]QSA96561.1 FecR family protein [Methylococcus sp. EFPC2]